MSVLIKPNHLSAEEFKECIEWFDSKPDVIKDIIIKYFNPMSVCYKSKENRGHYMLISIFEDGTLMVGHLPDSFLPNHNVFDMKPETLVKCGCLYEENK